MENQVVTGVNVAPDSTTGHYVKDARKVISLDETTRSYFVEGKSKLETANHTSLNRDTSVFITCQMVVNPFTKMYERSRD